MSSIGSAVDDVDELAGDHPEQTSFQFQYRFHRRSATVLQHFVTHSRVADEPVEGDCPTGCLTPSVADDASQDLTEQVDPLLGAVRLDVDFVQRLAPDPFEVVLLGWNDAAQTAPESPETGTQMTAVHGPAIPECGLADQVETDDPIGPVDPDLVDHRGLILNETLPQQDGSCRSRALRAR